MLPQNLTIKSLIATVAGIVLLKLLPSLPAGAVTELAQALANLLVMLGPPGIAAGYMRRVYTPAAPEIEAQAHAQLQGFLGKQGWRDVRGAIKDASHDTLMVAIEALFRRVMAERDQPPSYNKLITDQPPA